MCSLPKTSTVWLSLGFIQVFVTWGWAQNDHDTSIELTVEKKQEILAMVVFFLKRNDLWNVGRVQAGKKQNVFYWCLFSRHYVFPTHNSEWFAQMTCIISHWQLCKKTVPISDLKINKQKYLILFTLLWHFYNRFTYTSWSLSRTRPYTWVI